MAGVLTDVVERKLEKEEGWVVGMKGISRVREAKVRGDRESGKEEDSRNR